jgi:hypothetical protein
MSLTQSLQSGPSKVTIFGREPSVWVGLIESGLAALTAFGIGQWAGLTQETYGTWVVLIAALSGFLTAFLTKDTMLGVTLGLFKAVVAFIAIYGLSLTDQQTGAVIAFLPLLVSLYQRTQTAPIVNGEVLARDPVEVVATVPVAPEVEVA